MGVTTLLLAALLSQTLPQAEPTPTITAVEVRLPAGDGADAKLLARVPGLVSVRRGQPLSRRAVQRSIENLFATGHFADLIVEATEGPEGVALTFELVPRRSVVEAYVEGNHALTNPEALAATRVEVSSEFWPERIEQAAQSLAELYRRRGYRAVSVTTRVDTTEGGVAVGFVVEEGAPTRISSIGVAGDPGLPLPKVLETMAVKPGDVLDQTVLDAAVERLRAAFRAERYYGARVDQAQLDARGRVLVPITAGPHYDIVFSGNRSISSGSLTAVLAYKGEETLDSGLAQRLAQRLARFYRFHGFHDVIVTPSEVQRPGQREAALGFAIEEGALLRVVELAFEGNQKVTDGELREVLARVTEASAPSTSFEVHGQSDPLELEGRSPTHVFAAELPTQPWETVLDEPAWLEATRAMTALYRERGFLKASVRLDHVLIEHGQARARFVIEEGPLAVFRGLVAQGLPPGFHSDAVDALQRSPGPFSTDALEHLRQELAHELGRKGYVFANLRTSWALDDTARFVDSVITAEAGPQVRVRAILPVGNVRTSDDVLLQQALMQEGEVLDVDTLFKTQNNLIGLGIFRTVDVELLTPERPEPLKTVVLKVKERPRYSSEVSFGYFLADGPRVVVDLGASDLGGRAVNLNGHFQVNFVPLSYPVLNRQIIVDNLPAWEQIGGRANISIQSRSVLPANIGLRLDVVLERVFRPQFLFNRAAAVPTIDWTHTFEVPRIEWLHPKLSLALQYELEWSYVAKTGTSVISDFTTSAVDLQRLRFLFGNFLLQTVRFSPTLDLRDSSLNPHKGLLLQASSEVTGAISAYDDASPANAVKVNFLKTSGLATVYLPLYKSLVLALSVRGGRIFPLVDGSTTPPVRRFFLGGATSMRGFNEDQLIAQDTRSQYQTQVASCRLLAAKDGCTDAARAVQNGVQVPSQGGELFALTKVELRFPAFSVFDLGVFVEAGNLWLSVPDTFGPFRYVAGAGVRYVTPIGPLALDLGVNLAPDTQINEPTFVVHFNIGVF
jgi:outer membrane protein assembly factor BamA